jgi:hypothetical protein
MTAELADGIEPTRGDYDAALRLSREYLYDGHEPYAPAVTSIASMLAAHRVEQRAFVVEATASVVAALQQQVEKLRTDLADLVRVHNETLVELHKRRKKYEVLHSYATRSGLDLDPLK